MASEAPTPKKTTVKKFAFEHLTEELKQHIVTSGSVLFPIIVGHSDRAASADR